jgi:hypothetical protein
MAMLRGLRLATGGAVACALLAMALTMAAAQRAKPCDVMEPDSLGISWMAPCDEGRWLFDPQSGCQMWDWHPAPEDTSTWTGACPAGRKEGRGEDRRWNRASWPQRSLLRYALGGRFNPAATNLPIASDRLSPVRSAQASIASITAAGTLPETTGSLPVAGRPGFRLGATNVANVTSAMVEAATDEQCKFWNVATLLRIVGDQVSEGLSAGRSDLEWQRLGCTIDYLAAQLQEHTDKLGDVLTDIEGAVIRREKAAL